MSASRGSTKGAPWPSTSTRWSSRCGSTTRCTDTHRADNEAESAALARAEGGRAGLAEPRPRLYGTDAFRERFEDPARANLARSILALGG